jgi:hypothetical protein
MNDQALINVINAKKKNRYFIGLKHAANLGSKGGKQKSLFPYVFGDPTRQGFFYWEWKLEAANTSFPYELLIPYKFSNLDCIRVDNFSNIGIPIFARKQSW